MTAKAHDQWAGRDFPVLVTVAKLLDENFGSPLQPDDVMAESALDQQDVIRALLALASGYVTIQQEHTQAGGIPFVTVTGLTERGRRAAGLWPDGDAPDALVDLLQRAASTAADPDEKSRLRRAADALTGVGQGVMTDVLAALIKAQAGV